MSRQIPRSPPLWGRRCARNSFFILLNIKITFISCNLHFYFSRVVLHLKILPSFDTSLRRIPNIFWSLHFCSQNSSGIPELQTRRENLVELFKSRVLSTRPVLFPSWKFINSQRQSQNFAETNLRNLALYHPAQSELSASKRVMRAFRLYFAWGDDFRGARSCSRPSRARWVTTLCPCSLGLNFSSLPLGLNFQSSRTVLKW